MKNDLKCLAKDNLPIAIALGSGDHQATQVEVSQENPTCGDPEIATTIVAEEDFTANNRDS